jgi:hypothetical protein
LTEKKQIYLGPVLSAKGKQEREFLSDPWNPSSRDPVEVISHDHPAFQGPVQTRKKKKKLREMRRNQQTHGIQKDNMTLDIQLGF